MADSTAARDRAFEVLRADVSAEIARVYDGNDYLVRPDPGDVIAEALATVRSDLRDRAEDEARCNRVDECTATAIVLRRLADWLETGEVLGALAGVPAPDQT